MPQISSTRNILLLIGVLCALIYSNTFWNPFVFDDKEFITYNPQLQPEDLSVESWLPVITKSRPVTRLSFALNYYAGGQEVIGYHLVNLALHILTAIVFYFLLITAADLEALRGRVGPHAGRLALLGVILWAVHPVQTQSVTYIVQRATVMAAFFYLSAILAYLVARRTTGPRKLVWYGLCALFFMLAVGSKEWAASLPLFLALIEICFLSGSDIRRLWVRLVFPASLVLIPGLVVWVYFAEQGHGILQTLERFLTTPRGQFDYSLKERLLTQPRVMIYYLSLLLFPHPARLTLDYDYPASQSLFSPLTTFPSLILVTGSILYALLNLRKRPVLSFCILWFYGNLAIESVLIKLDLVFEHRLYLPSMGILVLAAIGIHRLWVQLEANPARVLRRAAFGAGVVLIAVLCLWTYQRNAVWQSPLSLWEDTVQKSPGRARARQSLGLAYAMEGKYELALREYHEALRLRPHHTETRMNLGFIYQKMGVLDLAQEVYEGVLEENPRWYSALVNLGMVRYDQEDYTGAAELLRRAVDAQPSNYQAYFNLGKVYTEMGEEDLALEAYKKSRELNPKFIPVYSDMAAIYERRGDTGPLAEIYERMLRLDWRDSNVRYKLGQLYHRQRRMGEAVDQYETVLSIDPGHLDARNNLGSAYAAQGRLDAAVKEFEKVLAARPDHPAARVNLTQAKEALARSKR